MKERKKKGHMEESKEENKEKGKKEK